MPDDLLLWARNVVLFGYQYRTAFEEDERSDADTHYYMSPHDMLVFVGVAVLSGIIGNVAYDLLKGTIKNLLNRWSRSRTFRNRLPTALLSDDAEIDRFIRYVREYHAGSLESASAHVHGHIYQEILAFTSSNLVMERLEHARTGGQRPSRDEIRAMVMRELETMTRMPNIDRAAVDETWGLATVEAEGRTRSSPTRPTSDRDNLHKRRRKRKRGA